MKNIIKKFKEMTLVEIVITIAITLCIGFMIATPFIQRATATTVIITVEDKGTKRSGSNMDKYLIYTDNGTYEITDSIAFFRWNSSDLYGSMKIGSTYECTVCGFRNPFLSSYENIITATEVKGD